ncbi:cuticle protein [Sarcoptes scabiei]|nr:cuticle protein [Sarcoptes scabiei]
MMGCVYSDLRRSKNKSKQQSTTNVTSNDSNQSHSNDGDRKRIFNACSVKEKQNGQIEITENELIFFFDKGKRLEWPLKYLRGYGSSNGLFSFECGRKCSTGSGVFVFDCPQAGKLMETLTRQIDEMANSNLRLNENNPNDHNHNSHNNLINHHHHNAPRSSTQLHFNQSNGNLNRSQVNLMVSQSDRRLHEYQNTTELIRQSPFPIVGDQIDHHRSLISSQPSIVMPSSSSLNDRLAHTYQNSNVLEQTLKSEPNYYSLGPTIGLQNNHNNCNINVSKHSLNESSSSRSDQNSFAANRSFDSKTLPSMKNLGGSRQKSFDKHSYVNTFIEKDLSDSNQIRRNSDCNRDTKTRNCYSNLDHIVQTYVDPKKLEQIQTKINEFDNMGTFCYVNFDNNRKHSSNLKDVKSRTRKAPKIQSYVLLDLNMKANDKNCRLNANDHNDDGIGDNLPSIDSKIEPDNDDDDDFDQNYVKLSRSSNSKADFEIENLKIIDQKESKSSSSPIPQNQSTLLPKSMIIGTNASVTDLKIDFEEKQSSSNHFPSSITSSTLMSIVSSNNNGGNNNTISYAQIDFAKTTALSNSTANHRKL